MEIFPLRVVHANSHVRNLKGDRGTRVPMYFMRMLSTYMPSSGQNYRNGTADFSLDNAALQGTLLSSAD